MKKSNKRRKKSICKTISQHVRKSGARPFSQHVGKWKKAYKVELVPASEIQPSPENTELYGQLDFRNDSALPLLSRSIADIGLEEPIILTLDNFILSGHRRFHVVTN